MAKDDEDIDEPDEDEDGLEDGEDGEGSEGALKRRRMSGKTLVLFGGPAVVLLIGGIAGFVFGAFDPLIHAVLGTEPPAEGEAAENVPEEVVFYDLPEMLVNLRAGGKQTNFLKLKVALEIKKSESVEALEHLLPRIIDNFQVYMRELRIEDLDGSAGMFRIKEELLSRVNAAVYPVEVNDILFKEMLIQ